MKLAVLFNVESGTHLQVSRVARVKQCQLEILPDIAALRLRCLEQIDLD